jgi:hypothetical protein
MRRHGGKGRRNTGLAALAVASCAAAGLGAATATTAAPGDPLLPDLRTQPHEQLYVQGNQLRLSNTISNRGVGPAEIYPEPTAGGDCDGDGRNGNDRIAFQRIFKDSANPNSPGYFVRGQDTVSTSVPVGCMIYHPAHAHWHFEDFSQYLLRAESTGLIVSRSTKISFCVIDTDHTYSGLPGSPGGGYYGNNGCGPTSVEGLSIGWADTYGAYLQGQSLHIAGLPAATYCLISRADPVDRLDELSETNNGRRTRIQLDPAAHTVQRLGGACQSP